MWALGAPLHMGGYICLTIGQLLDVVFCFALLSATIAC